MVEPSATEHITPRRAPIPKRVRFEVLRRDNYTCRYCRSTENPLTIDHVIPEVLGGRNDPSNLVAACKDCNAGKSSSSPGEALVAQVSEDALRWSAAMREAGIQTLRRSDELRDRLDAIHGMWLKAVPEYRRQQAKWRLPSDWAQAVERLLVAGLPDVVVWDCIYIAAGSRGNVDNAFRYMLGVANNKLRQQQEQAAAILAEEGR